MSPAIKPGSMVFITPPQNLAVGDIVSFSEGSWKSGKSTGRKLTHRIVQEINLDGRRAFVTKGDANPQPDPSYVYSDKILGKITFVIPYLGYVNFLMQTKWGLTVFLFLPIAILVYSEVRIIKKYLRITKC